MTPVQAMGVLARGSDCHRGAYQRLNPLDVARVGGVLLIRLPRIVAGAGPSGDVAAGLPEDLFG